MADDDRRHHARFRLWLPTQIEGAGEEMQLAIGHDVSQGGVLLVTSEALSVGDSVRLVVRIPPEEGKTITLNARVLRCSPNEQDPQGLWPFQAALEFEESVPELEKLIREHTDMVEGLADAGEQTS